VLAPAQHLILRHFCLAAAPLKHGTWQGGSIDDRPVV
jgi:hypothetical protein